MLRPYITTDQISYPTQVTGTLLADGRGEQNRTLGVYARVRERLANRHQRRQPARVVRDPGPFQPWPVPRHRDVQLGPKHGVEVGAQDNTGTGPPAPAAPAAPAAPVCLLLTVPCADVADLIDLHVREADLPK